MDRAAAAKVIGMNCEKIRLVPLETCIKCQDVLKVLARLLMHGCRLIGQSDMMGLTF